MSGVDGEEDDGLGDFKWAIMGVTSFVPCINWMVRWELLPHKGTVRCRQPCFCYISGAKVLRGNLSINLRDNCGLGAPILF